MDYKEYTKLMAGYKNLYWAGGIPWEIYQGFLQPVSPPQYPIKLTRNEIKMLIKMTGALFIRWHTDFDCKDETGWWFVIKDGSSSLDELSKKMKNQVKKGLKLSLVKQVNAGLIAQNSYALYKTALQEYGGIVGIVSEEAYVSSILRDNNFPDLIEYFGVFCEDKLVGYSKNYIQGEVVSYAVIKFDPAYLSKYISYALIYEMNSYYLNERKMKFVYDGERSLLHESNFQDYLISKFKFRKAYCRLNVVYSRWFGLLIFALYPFKKSIVFLSNVLHMPFLRKIKAVLLQEELARNCRQDKLLNRIY